MYRTTAPLCLVLLFMAASVSLEAKDKKEADRKEQKKEATLLSPESSGRVSGILELSGACAGPEGKSLFVVGDKGQIAEVDLSGKVLRQKFLGDRDFEAVAVLPGGKRLLLLDESRRELLWLDAGSFSILGTRALAPPDLGLKRLTGIDQFEGMAVRAINPRETLVWLSFHEKGEHFSRIESVVIEGLTLSRRGPDHWRVEKESDIAELCLSRDGRSLYLLDDHGDRILRLENGKKTVVVSKIPGIQQESLALVPKGLRVFAENGDSIDYPVLP